VIPEVEGSAYVYGFANWFVDDRDPLTYGFLVR
jgi:proline racemase